MQCAKFRQGNTITDGAILSGWKEETVPVTSNTSYNVWTEGKKINSYFPTPDTLSGRKEETLPVISTLVTFRLIYYVMKL